MSAEVNAFEVMTWGVSALLALGAALAALRFAKVGPLWAVVIGILVFTVLQFPIKTHAVMLEMPRQNSN